MERKIGEIFEYNGEWYQCVEQPKKYDKTVCAICAFQGNGNCELDRCSGTYISDKKFVIFKKLEKVGEPFFVNIQGNNVLEQRYKLYEPMVTLKEYWYRIDGNFINIEIKQNQENMEEKKIQHYDCFFDKKKSNLKPFDIQKAREGKPVCTRDGRKARIICFDRDWVTHIVALVSNPLGESVHYYLSNGKVDFDKQNNEDLMMLPEKKDGWINVKKDASLFKSREEAERNCTKDYVPVRVEFEI